MLGKERREWMYLPRLSHSPDRLTLSPSLSLTPKFSLHLASLFSPPVSPFLTHTPQRELFPETLGGICSIFINCCSSRKHRR